MVAFTKNASLIWRVVICIAALALMIVFFAKEIVPSVPLFSVFIWVIGCAVVFFVAITAVVFVQSSINRFVIKKGGTDTAWFWFSSDPPGVAQVRRELENNSNNSKD